MKKVIDFILLQNSVNREINKKGEAIHADADRLNEIGDSLSSEENELLCKYAKKELVVAIFIDAKNKSLKYILVEPKIEWYYKLIGSRYIEAAYPFKSNNHLYIDEEGFLKPNNTVYYKGLGYQLAGNAIVLSSDEEGNDLSTTLTLDDVRDSIIFVQ